MRQVCVLIVQEKQNEAEGLLQDLKADILQFEIEYGSDLQEIFNAWSSALGKVCNESQSQQKKNKLMMAHNTVVRLLPK
jgi:hypothetical protein